MLVMVVRSVYAAALGQGRWRIEAPESLAARLIGSLENGLGIIQAV
jgi:hypothetical protein